MKNIIARVHSKTTIPKEGVELNIQSIDHIIKNNVDGVIVECGVWKGGSMAAMLYRLQEHNDVSREAYLFDTFAGMTKPTEEDTKFNSNVPAMIKFNKSQKSDHNEWCYAALEEAQKTMKDTMYPTEKINYIIGDVNETAAKHTQPIAILRIDVDFYEAVKSCLEELYPKVSKNGIIIFDDYGIWKGAKKAVDEYFEGQDITLNEVRHIRWMRKA